MRHYIRADKANRGADRQRCGVRVLMASAGYRQTYTTQLNIDLRQNFFSAAVELVLLPDPHPDWESPNLRKEAGRT